MKMYKEILMFNVILSILHFGEGSYVCDESVANCLG